MSTRVIGSMTDVTESQALAALTGAGRIRTEHESQLETKIKNYLFQISVARHYCEWPTDGAVCLQRNPSSLCFLPLNGIVS